MARTRLVVARRSLAVFPLSLALALAAGARAADTPPPTAVTIAGSLQSELGCAGDWDPGCAATHLALDAEDGVWQGAFGLPAGAFEYKAALNGTWDENYGANAARNGANIPLGLAAPRTVKFYYDHETHWITDGANSVIAVAPGSFQSELGCAGDWDPGCLRSWLKDPDGDGIYSFTTSALPAGSYEVKVAIGESWTENYGAGGVQNGPNIPFTVESDCATTTFTYDAATHLLTVAPAALPAQPASVTIAGSLQSELGCPGDWQPECATTGLALDAADGVWQGTFSVPAGGWEYKAALNGSWDENYGANATPNGANIALSLGAPASVKFYYDHATHWITSSRNAVIATVPGSFQSELGCPGDWDPGCLRSWLQDPDGDGIYTFTTSALPAGSYEAKVAIDESWDENYGEGGARNGANIAFTVPAACGEITFAYDAATHVLTIGAIGAPKGNLNRAQAHWVTEDTIAWGLAGVAADWTVSLHRHPAGGLALGADGVSGDDDPIPLAWDPAGLPGAVKAKFPHLSNLAAFRIPQDRLADVPEALKGQLAVSAKGGAGALVDATSLQLPGVLDDLYAYDGPLGVTFHHGVPTLRVWAPTARSVSLEVFDSSTAATPSVHAMSRDGSGVWSVTGPASWNRKFYRYAVEVFVRSTKQVETNRVTDPYSVSLATNSARSQIVDLDDRDLKPWGWDALRKPRLDAPEDVALYELHVRDFSASDPSVPEAWRGTYRAFTLPWSNGMRHLAKLAKAGLTHVHLLPTFDIATVDEDRSTWLEPAGDLSSFPPDSEEQQARVSAVSGRDGFNWGYDPWHYDVPEGSYATRPDGAARIREYRAMVQGLARAGLRVVNDVVYNHTTASGQNAKSVLDRIVPGYYHRLNANGEVERSTCCENTATEHDMMEKLMVDSVVLWAKQYKVDGFRFDLMGHHMKRNMLAVRAALDALTPEHDGVDGRRIYVYGEGWNFGEVADDARGVNATQRNMFGTGIGSFNDRMRDGARGGGPFSGIQEQGFLTGLFFDPNATAQPTDPAGLLRLEEDWVQVGLAASLATFPLENAAGHTVLASQVDYKGQPAGYTGDPQEVINYVSAHDNETLFDAIQLKVPVPTSMEDRVRVQNLGMSLVALSQGVPFFHAGDDLLRSKSLDRNSYDSGDWFNRLDFTYETSNWGVGLPPAADNQASWGIHAPLLADPALRPSREDIERAADHLREILAVRKSTKLFRLRTAEDVVDRVRFHDAGPDGVPGLVVMSIADPAGEVDPQHPLAVVLFNAGDEPVRFEMPDLAKRHLHLHPVLAESSDPVVREAHFNRPKATFHVPARTTAVFWETRHGKPR